jgi:hypothetical protein
VVVLGAILGLVVASGSGRRDQPRLEVEVLGPAPTVSGERAVSVRIVNPSRWRVTRHAEYRIGLEELGDRLETLLPARELAPGDFELVAVPVPEEVNRWRVEFRYTGWETGWQWRMRRWREWLGGFGFVSHPRGPRPETFFTCSVVTEWITNAPGGSMPAPSP